MINNINVKDKTKEGEMKEKNIRCRPFLGARLILKH